MNEHYFALLDSTLEHLRRLKSDGQRFVVTDVEGLKRLKNAPALVRPKPVLPQATTGARTIPAPTQAAVAPGPEPSFTVSKTPAQALSSPSAADSPAPPEVRGSAPAAGLKPESELVQSNDKLSSVEKEAAMKNLRERALVCVKCPHLAASRQNVVFGVGDIHSALMFVGEAPGSDEDLQGEPFVGTAGQLLTKIIQTMGFTRQSVYIANVLKCRPDTPGQSFGNRKPTPEEMKTCLPYLMAQIDLIQPKVIVALGATAMEGLFGRPAAISKERGIFKTLKSIPVMPTFHPAYLLRNTSFTEKRKTWEDMLQVMEKLNRPISEKERGYFLTPR